MEKLQSVSGQDKFQGNRSEWLSRVKNKITGQEEFKNKESPTRKDDLYEHYKSCEL